MPLRNLRACGRQVQEETMTRWTTLALPLGTLLTAGPLDAQGVVVGDRVRALHGDWVRVEGPVVAADDSTFSLRGSNGLPVRLAYRDAFRIERYDGRASAGRGALRGAGIGFLVGAVPSVLVTGVVHANATAGGYSDGSSAAGIAAYLGILFTAATTTVGAAVGAIMPPDRWTRLTPPVRVGLAPLGNGRVGLALSF